MGSGDSKGHLVVTCDEVSIYPGSEISGHIYIDLKKSTKKPTELTLVFSGNQIINHGKTKKFSIINETQKISFWEKGLKRGQYDFPFIYKISDKLYSSFSVSEKDYSANIVYKLKGYLKSDKQKIKNALNLEIMEPVSIEKIPARALEKIHTKKICGVKNEIELKTELSSSMYFSDETIEFSFEFNHPRKKLDINSIMVNIERIIVLKDDESIEFSKRLHVARINSPIESGENYKAKFDLASNPNFSQPRTIRTDKIMCKYLLNLIFESKGICAKKIEEVKIDLMVLPRGGQVESLRVEAPEYWDPMYLPISRLSFNDYQPSAPVLMDPEEIIVYDD